ncbi:PilZ domain-containing protein [Novosphingobium album (ex Liu et al. 2023)]|uniref:PilZ domain-containing protein n=1 Tax=Novosphingobium album (ex Liu et al. 2023) TaxID=3031130 RepID=A0ABT5WT66_9SPHN|nr:PilZ domain-containing protein [Novosphingobium album (ex Liu et al. 2023)]MDE8653096.1 PilZ domain-containing protein [Novosphingobium album (ex Liu et al. 2023)]
MSREIRPRRAERKPVVLAAQCRTQSGLRDSGEISDISREGCCIATRALLLRVGARVVIRPTGLEGLTGVVRWISGDRAGIEFDQPLYEPIVDHIALRHSAGEPVDIARR